jgi:carboxyl-terminal processing protease
MSRRDLRFVVAIGLWFGSLTAALGVVPARAFGQNEPGAATIKIVDPADRAPAAREGSLDASAPTSSQAQQLLRQGRQLEASEKWADALTHYEDALREYPNDRDLKERHDLARIHYDLGRRYHDKSFSKALDALDTRDALGIYHEVLLKIDAHYVQAPDWRQLVHHGTTGLDAALDSRAFAERNLRGVKKEQVDEFRRALWRTVGARTIRDRRDAGDAVTAAAELAQARIGLPPTVTILEYTCGATTALDTYSTFLSGDQMRDVFSQIEGNFVGLGIEIRTAERGLLVVHVIDGSPAAKAGLKPGDCIAAVEGRAITAANADASANLLQGEEGTTVKLAILSNDAVSKGAVSKDVASKDSVSQGARQREIEVRRAHVEVPSIEDVKILDRESGIGYLKLTSFQKTTCRDLDAALWRLHRDGMKSLIVDVRGNPGGLLSTSVEVADKFVSAGTLVSTRGRSAQEDFTYAAHKVGTWLVPLVVLVDGDSASASEIFAGAIQDNRRGTVVGRRSYGKGSVQGIFPLTPNASDVRCGVRLTTAKFYSPNGRPISGAGITPDVQVRRAAKPVADAGQTTRDAEDADLAAGLQFARKQLAER